MSLTVIVASLGAGIAGYIAGALSRQPEINELKSQVRSLQAEVDRLQTIISIQNSQIKELKIRYTALKGWQLSEKSRQKGYIKGSIIYQYALREYLVMLINANETDRVTLDKEEIQFYNSFGSILNNGEINEKSRKIVIDYVKKHYSTEISNYIEPDLSQIIDYFE